MQDSDVEMEYEEGILPSIEDTALIVVDFQGSLFKTMDSSVGQRTLQKTLILIEGAKLLGIPILVTEQYPRGLGPTMDEIRKALGDAYRPMEKLTFSLMGEEPIAETVHRLDRDNLILAGMETHICVLQSALELLDDGFYPFVAADAVCSRAKLDWEIGLSTMTEAGARVTSVETVCFSLFKKAGTPAFKAFSNLLK